MKVKRKDAEQSQSKRKKDSPNLSHPQNLFQPVVVSFLYIVQVYSIQYLSGFFFII